MQHILVTGGAGYIGSHTCLSLLEQGYKISVIDNLSNGYIEALKRVEQLSGQAIDFFQADLKDEKQLSEILKRQQVDAVIHFAGVKSVAESVADPLSYYQQNVSNSIHLLNAMKQNTVFQFIFSSSATVYGLPNPIPLYENSQLNPANPYGQSKLMVENICRDLVQSDERWHISLLRYFNPVGAHPSGLIGESPRDVPNNLLPFITLVALGKNEYLSVFGNDYKTHDGTGVRDYIHIMDLAYGHTKALKAIQNKRINCFNLGCGKGYSVLEMLNTFENINNLSIPYRFVPRRAGDIAEYYANADKAKKQLDWQCHYTIEDIVRDAWRWQQQNPNGYT